MAKGRLKPDHVAKTITMYQKAFETLSAEEETLVAKYQSIGYDIIILDNKAPKKAKGNDLKEAQIRKALEKNEEALKTFEAKKAEGGYLVAKNWYLKEFKKK